MAPNSKMQTTFGFTSARGANDEGEPRKQLTGLGVGQSKASLKRPGGSEPAPVAKRPKPSSSTPSADGESGKLTGADFLNSLADNEARGLFDLMKTEGPPTRSCILSDEQYQLVRGLRAAPGSVRDGRWWTDLLTCEAYGKPDVKDHPRWQIDVDSQDGLVHRVQKLLSVESFAKFKSLATVGDKSMVKLQRHHVALNADRSRSDGPLIPSDSGKGGSVSHLCDRKGCVRACHLETAAVHKTNLSRQRCQGVMLLCLQGVIVQEQPCAHAQAGDGSLASMLQNSCLGNIRVLVVSDESARLISSLLGQSAGT